MSQNGGRILKTVSVIVGLVVILASSFVGYGALRAESSNNKEDIKQLVLLVKGMTDVQQSHEARISVNEANIQSIKENVKEIKGDTTEIKKDIKQILIKSN